MNIIIDDLRDYLINTKPLNIRTFAISELGGGEYNHNYTLQLPDKKVVVRVSLSQLSGNRNQLKHEYDVLRYLKGRQIAPEVYFIDMKGFDYPLLIEEFIEGSPIATFNHETLVEIGSIIAKLNNTPILPSHPFEVRNIDYNRDIVAHQNTYRKLKINKHNQSWFKATESYIDKAKTQLNSKVPSTKAMLIRRDANPNNFIMTDQGMRLVDWEITRIDDPVITLASFINEVMSYDILRLNPTQKDMDIVKQTFLKQCPISDFDVLLKNRLIVEQLGGLVWALERMDNLLKHNADKSDYEQKIAWYKKVAHKSSIALTASLA